MIIDVIPARIGLDDFACRLHLRAVVGQEEGREFVPQPLHDQLPHGAFVADEPDPFLDILDLATLPLGLGDLAVLPARRREPLHACQHARAAAADRDETHLTLIQLTQPGIGARARIEQQAGRVGGVSSNGTENRRKESVRAYSPGF